jgi:hypothetical protein
MSEARAALIDSYMLSKYLWVLYDSDAQVHEDAEDTETTLRGLVGEAKPEIETIYNAIKEVGFSSRNISEAAWKKKAEGVFAEQRGNFKLIKSEYLQDRNIYFLNPGKEKRDFVGALLKKIVEKETGKLIGGQKLYDKYYKTA